MEKTALQVILLLFEVACFALLVLLFVNARRKKHAYKHENEKLREILATAPGGYFYFLPATKNEVCSRRLAVLLGIFEPNPDFGVVLKKLSAKSQTALQKAVTKLRETGKEFTLQVTDMASALRLVIVGIRAASLDGTVFADILWFQNETDILTVSEENEKKLKLYQLRDELFTNALDGLPFALWLRNFDLSLAYCNQAYLKLAGQKSREEVIENHIELDYDADKKMSPKILAISAKSSGEIKSEKGTFMTGTGTTVMEVYEVPLHQDRKAEERYTLGFTKNIQTEETLRQTLQNYLSAQYQVLGSLASGIAIFDANAYLQFFNKAFCDIWKLEEEWLAQSPSLAGILDRLREKRMLSEEANFLRYKHHELQQFSTLTKPLEDILHLPTGKILKRSMSPYPLGGMVMTFEDVTDRVSLESSYNEQIEIQRSIINHLTEGMIVFNAAGILKLFNEAYLKLFKADAAFLKGEPTLMDVLESQKNILAQSEDIWLLLKEKILLSIENEKSAMPIQTSDNLLMVFKTARLPDGGLLLSYEISD